MSENIQTNSEKNEPDTSGHITQQQVSVPESSDESDYAEADNSKPQQQIGVIQDSKSVTINETQEVGSGNGADTNKPTTRDVAECEYCQIKDSRIKELEDVVRKTTPLTPANQMAEVGDDKIKQLQKELDERIREFT